MADPDRIGQVVTNYLTNALKYSIAAMPVDVHLTVEQGLARVAVRDRGPGLPLEEQQRLWQRFYRVAGINVRSGSGVGLGLGLYICRSIIERHYGEVGVQSAPGQGSTFWFTLPLIENENENESESSQNVEDLNALL
jgi:signal transduction histidine kinase